jgi:hypothetical protein
VPIRRQTQSGLFGLLEGDLVAEQFGLLADRLLKKVEKLFHTVFVNSHPINLLLVLSVAKDRTRRPRAVCEDENDSPIAG